MRSAQPLSRDVLAAEQNSNPVIEHPAQLQWHSRLTRLLGSIVHDAGAPFAPEATVVEQEDAATEHNEAMCNARLATARYYFETQLDEHEGLREAVQLMHERGYAHDMPDFAGQCADETRTTTFRTRSGRLQTEHEGLRDFWTIFQAISENSGEHRMRSFRYPNGEARRLLEGVNFLGQREFEYGALLASAYIKSWLLDNPDGQLCLAPFVSELTNEAKSDLYVQDAILAHFRDEELDAYRGRLVFNPSDMDTHLPVEKRRVLIADDCIITGAQMDTVRRQFKELYPHLFGQLEILTFVLPRNFLEPTHRNYFRAPLVSCYRASSSLITSLHSTSQELADSKQELSSGEAFDVLKKAGIHTGSSQVPGLLRIRSPYQLSSFTTDHIDRACRVLGIRPPTDL